MDLFVVFCAVSSAHSYCCYASQAAKKMAAVSIATVNCLTHISENISLLFYLITKNKITGQWIEVWGITFEAMCTVLQ